jgi:capsular polysaccharide transport system ATP-binding protein
MPIKSYSSGMRARLSFGLSMAFDFDYYLIDEVTSVGDASFKDKSDALIKNKMENSNIILVSHSVGKIKKFCNAGILIGRKEVTYYENIDEAIAAYQQDEADHQSSLKNK